MSSSAKPTIILVPGAWHPPSAFDPLTKYLESNGYKVVGISLKTVGAAEPQDSFDEDVELIHDTIKKNAPAVVLTHSYGGVPGSSACLNLPPGAVQHFIFCCSFALPVGVSLMDALQGKPLPWFAITPDGKSVMPATPIETFYNDIPDTKTQEALIGSLRRHSYLAFTSPNKYAVWEDVKCTYVACEDDNAIPLPAQLGMVEGAKKMVQEKQGAKGGMDSVTLKASHSPFVSMPEKVGQIVRRCAGETGA